MVCGHSSAYARFRADRATFPPVAWLYERALWAVAAYRAGQWLRERFGTPLPVRVAMQLLNLLAQILTGIELPAATEIGPGLRIHHGGPIVVNPRSVLGSGCTLRHGVTIGNLDAQGPAPVVGDGVEFGAYAQAFGGISIGDGARIGAMAVVLCDVPAGATAVGVPARVIPPVGLVTETQAITTST